MSYKQKFNLKDKVLYKDKFEIGEIAGYCNTTGTYRIRYGRGNNSYCYHSCEEKYITLITEPGVILLTDNFEPQANACGESPIKTICKKCGGTGILDFQFYTRDCFDCKR